MNIYLNGEARQVPDHTTAAQLVDDLGLSGKRIAMEVNREIIPRSGYADYRLQPEDSVEIVHAIGGGQSRQGREASSACTPLHGIAPCLPS